VPEEYGGAGLGNMHAAILLEEVNRWDPSVGVTISVHMSLSCSCINKWGSPEVKAKYLPKLATGELLGAYCLTEPGAGSDAGSMRTRAVKVDGGWKITGTKSWITTGPQAGLYIVYAVTDPEGRRGGNIGAFLVERTMEGVTVGKKEIKLGLRGSSTTEMIFDEVFVPDENLMGDGLNGFKIALDTHWYCRAVFGHSPCLSRRVGQVLERTRAVWQADRRVPGHRVEARRYGDFTRSQSHAGLACRMVAR
jgi:alkylation response protein AidB-like acyl-CoA dehydrogenase